jgi:methionyl-tRNA formyltransferase
MSKLKLAFMGTPDFSAPALQALYDAGYEIVAVYTQPPRKSGRGQKLKPSPIHALADQLGVEVRTPRSLKNAEAQQAFAALGADACVVVAYGLILPKAILDATRLGCFNIHASLLPRWRGAAPIQRAVMAGDMETGLAIMKMEVGLDTGPVMITERMAIDHSMTAEQVHDTLSGRAGPLIVNAMQLISDGNAKFSPQQADGVTYAEKISADEARIDWRRSAAELDCHIRGLSPFPGAWCMIGEERIKILCAEPIDGSGAPGEALDDRLTVACGKGALALTRLQRAGKAPMEVQDLLRGFVVKQGEMLA